MADITIDASISASINGNNTYGPFWVDDLVGYSFIRDSGGGHVYYKTIDGGSSWTGPTTLTSDSAAVFATWYDKWTPNHTGTKVHFVWSAASFIKYASFDLSDESISSEVTVYSVASDSAGWLTVARAEGGDIYIATGSSNSGTFAAGLFHSDDEGASWTSKTITGSSITTAVGDNAKLIPANRDDTNDIALWIYDASDTANGRFKFQEYDLSGNSWSTTNLASGSGSANNELCVWVSINHANKHAQVFGVYDNSSVLTIFHRDVEKVGGTISGINNIDTPATINGLSGMYDQNDSVIYVSWVESTAQHIEYKSSSDAGSSWTSVANFSDATGSYALPTLSVSIGTDGGRFMVTWRDTSANDWFTNFSNSVAISGGGAGSQAAGFGGSGGGNYQVLIDWSDDGDFTDADEDVTNDIRGLKMAHKRDLKSDHMNSRVVTLTLNNSSHKYSPPNGNSSIITTHGAGAISPDKSVWVRYFYPFDSFTGSQEDLEARTVPNDDSWSWVSPHAGREFETDGSGNAQTKQTDTGDFISYMEFNDDDVTICANITTGASGGDPGLVVRFADTDEYVKLRITNGSSSNIILIDYDSGNNNTINSGDFTWSSGETHFVVIEIHGTQYRVLIDNTEVINTTFTDSALDNATKHGIICHGSNSTVAEWQDFGGFKSLFFGVIEDVAVQARHGGDHTAVIRCVDDFERMNGHQLRFANTLQTSGSVASGTMMGELLTAMDFPSNRRLIDTGTSIMDDVDEGLKAIDGGGLAAVRQLQDEEDGFAYIDGYGYLHFEQRTHRTAAPHTNVQGITSDKVNAGATRSAFAQIRWEDGKKNIENQIDVKVRRATLRDAKTVVWRSSEASLGRGDSTIEIPTLESRDFLVDIGETQGQQFISADAWVLPTYDETRDPTAASESGAEWTGESNVFASDDSRAVYNDTTRSVLEITNFGFDIPEEAVITRIRVSVEGHGDSATGAERDIDLDLTKDGSSVIAGADTVTHRLNQSTDQTTFVSGTTDDLWGTNFSPAEINATTFGVLLVKTTATANQIEIDHIRVDVEFIADVEANSAADGTGSDETDSLTLAFQDTSKYAGKWQLLRVTNTSGSTIYVTKLQVRATPRVFQNVIPVGVNTNSAASSYPINDSEVEVLEEDATSVADYGERRKSITAKFISRYTAARTLAISRRDRRKDPKTILTLVYTPRDKGTLREMVMRRISDRIQVNYTDMGISNLECFLEGESWELFPDTSRVVVEWLLREA